MVRFLGVPLFIWLVLSEHEYGYGALVLAIMASTDWVDGYIARRFNQMSNLGRVMDPIANRLSLIAVAVTLVIAGVDGGTFSHCWSRTRSCWPCHCSISTATRICR